MDIRLPDASGIDAAIAIRDEFPQARILILSTFEGDVDIHRALAAGARSPRGLRNREIADRLNITEETVKVHLRHIFEKLAARDRIEAVAIALRRGFIHL